MPAGIVRGKLGRWGAHTRDTCCIGVVRGDPVRRGKGGRATAASERACTASAWSGSAIPVTRLWVEAWDRTAPAIDDITVSAGKCPADGIKPVTKGERLIAGYTQKSHRGNVLTAELRHAQDV